MSKANFSQTESKEVIQINDTCVTLFFSETTSPGTIRTLKNILCGMLPAPSQICHTTRIMR